MSRTRRSNLARCLLVWWGATSMLGVLMAWVLADLVAAQAAVTGPGLAAQPFDRMLVWVCSAAGLGAGAWLWSLTTLVVIEAIFDTRRPAVPGVPAGFRRCVLAACGIAIIGVATPALATPGSPHLDHTGRAGPAMIAGLPLPDRATGSPATDSPVTDSPAAATDRVVIVRRGDTLWAIARADLGATATNAEVAAHWQQVFALNRSVVGADPDLIHPDQRLALPPRRTQES